MRKNILSAFGNCKEDCPQDFSIPHNNRNDILDVAKGIGILLVVFAHVNFTPALETWIYSFHMPLFFFISGVLFHRDKYASFGSFLKRRTKTMVLPYLFFSILPIIGVFILDCIPFLPLHKSPDAYFNGMIQIFLAYDSASVFNTPLWFVPCLLAVEIMYWHLSKLPKWMNACMCIFLAGLGWLLESEYVVLPFRLPWSMDSALFSLSFFMTGNLITSPFICGVEKLRRSKFKILLCSFLIILLLSVSVPLAFLNGKVSLGSKILNNGFLFYTTGILGTLLVMLVSILLEKSRFMKYLGRNTFCIMGVHVIFKGYLLYPVCELLNITFNDQSVLESIIPFLTVLTLSLLAAEIYRSVLSKLGAKKR